MRIYERKGSPFWQVARPDPAGGMIRQSTGVHLSRPRTEAARAASRLPAPTLPGEVSRSLGEALDSYCEGLSGGYATTAASTSKKVGTIMGRETPLDVIDQIKVDHLRAMLRVKGNTDSTAGRALALLRAVMTQAKREGFKVGAGHIDWDIVSAPARERFLTPAEVSSLKGWLVGRLALDAADAVDLLVLTGLRWSELEGLTWAKADPGSGELEVLGKGQKVRRVPLVPAAKEALVRRLMRASAHELVARQDPVFWNPAELHRQITKAIDEARLNEGRRRLDRCTIHTLRHTFASLARQRGLPLDTLQALMGHASLTTTMRYAKVDDGQHAERLAAALGGLVT